MKTSIGSPLLRSLHFSFAALLSGLSCHGYAAPEGGVVRGGAGSISQAGDITTIEQTSQRLAIDWQSFSIGVNETVNFLQPSADALALNRVVSNEGSHILGRLNANGHVLLVNPNGVFFDRQARVNVGSLVASGLDVDADEFLSGSTELRAEGPGTVINNGLINAATGGDVVLVGDRVVNAGTITAHWGSVSLAAGSAAILTFDPDQRIGVKVAEVSSAEEGDAPAISVSGSIVAKGGNILLTAQESQDLFSSAVNTGDMAGTVAAQVHADGSFSLGRAADIVVDGSINSGSSNLQVDVEPVEPVDPSQVKTTSISIEGRNITISGGVVGFSSSGYASQVEIRATEVLRVEEDAAVYSEGDPGWPTPALPDSESTLTLTGKDIFIGQEAWIRADGWNGGTLTIGDERTERVFIDYIAFIYANADTSGSGRGGTISIHSSQGTDIRGILSANGGREAGGEGGDITMSSDGDLSFRSDIFVDGGSWADNRYLNPGKITFAGPNLVLGEDYASSNVIISGMLNMAAQYYPVHLQASESISVEPGHQAALNPIALTMTAEGSDGRPATIDLARLTLYSAHWFTSDVAARIEADGDIIAPQIGIAQVSDWNTPPLLGGYVPPEETVAIHPLTLAITSHGGSIFHPNNAYLYRGSYTASAAGDIRFAEGAELRTWERSDVGSGGSAKLKAGGDLHLNLNALRPTESTPVSTLALEGDHVTLVATQDIPSATIKARQLDTSANGAARLKADVTGTTRLVGGENSVWSVAGNFNAVDATLASGASLALNDSNEIILGDWSLTNALAEITSTGGVKQRTDGEIALSGSQLALAAKHINFGADGTASVILRDGGNTLTGQFNQNFRISGRFESCAADDSILFRGSKLANRVTIADTAAITLAPGRAIEFRLGQGADHFIAAAAGSFDVSLGSGVDTVEISSGAANVNLTDFDPEEDVLITSAP